MVIASRIFEEVAVEFGLTLSIPKTKLFAAGANFTAYGVAPLELGGGSVEVAKELKYFRSLIEACGGVLGKSIIESLKLPNFWSLCSWLRILVWRLRD